MYGGGVHSGGTVIGIGIVSGREVRWLVFHSSTFEIFRDQAYLFFISLRFATLSSSLFLITRTPCQPVFQVMFIGTDATIKGRSRCSVGGRLVTVRWQCFFQVVWHFPSATKSGFGRNRLPKPTACLAPRAGWSMSWFSCTHTHTHLTWTMFANSFNTN